MYKKVIQLSLPLLALGFILGCTSRIEVVKATDNSKGIRYFLPQPFLKVSPLKDGGVDVEIVYLPDPDNEYAIQAESVLGNYTIDINITEEGFLKTVSFNSDNTGISKQLIDSTAALEAAHIDARSEKEKSDKDQAKAEMEKKETALAEAEKLLEETTLSLDVATHKLTFLISQKGSEGAPEDINSQIFLAKLAVEEAQVKRDAALSAFEEKASELNAANAPRKEDSQVLEAPEAAFFRIEMIANKVSLVQDFEQRNRQTWRLPKETVVLPAFELQFGTGSSRVIRPDPKTGALKFKLVSNRIVHSVVNPQIVDGESGESLEEKPYLSIQAGGTTLIVDLPKSLGAKEYSVEAKLLYGAKDKQQEYPMDIPIRVEK
jgi:hypothetical protein